MARIAIGIEGEIGMKFLASVFSRQGFAVLFLAALLAACTVVVDDGPGPRPRPPRPEPKFCTMQYEPVCARRGGDSQTFANACLADRAGYRIVRDGPCRGGGGGEEQTFCTREYAPVCGRRHGEMRSFPNACEARAADYRIVGDGPC
ncbi:mll2655 [Mesorhizobium japonicum MAFF 303099]|uniref:Mll2655 protein n=2 Tax=Mesorhizobium japonicum TaxID=2066070 RepID=Q98HY5_RHILO|nr:mll2655 [Mesorhizobium japonicum MAFF 303099]